MLAGLHVAMLFEWCVQDLPSGYSHQQEEARAGAAKEVVMDLGDSFEEVEIQSSLLHAICHTYVGPLSQAHPVIQQHTHGPRPCAVAG